MKRLSGDQKIPPAATSTFRGRLSGLPSDRTHSLFSPSIDLMVNAMQVCRRGNAQAHHDTILRRQDLESDRVGRRRRLAESNGRECRRKDHNERGQGWDDKAVRPRPHRIRCWRRAFQQLPRVADIAQAFFRIRSRQLLRSADLAGTRSGDLLR